MYHFRLIHRTSVDSFRQSKPSQQPEQEARLSVAREALVSCCAVPSFMKKVVVKMRRNARIFLIIFLIWGICVLFYIYNTSGDVGISCIKIIEKQIEFSVQSFLIVLDFTCSFCTIDR